MGTVPCVPLGCCFEDALTGLTDTTSISANANTINNFVIIVFNHSEFFYIGIMLSGLSLSIVNNNVIAACYLFGWASTRAVSIVTKLSLRTRFRHLSVKKKLKLTPLRPPTFFFVGFHFIFAILGPHVVKAPTHYTFYTFPESRDPQNEIMQV